MIHHLFRFITQTPPSAVCVVLFLGAGAAFLSVFEHVFQRLVESADGAAESFLKSFGMIERRKRNGLRLAAVQVQFSIYDEISRTGTDGCL